MVFCYTSNIFIISCFLSIAQCYKFLYLIIKAHNSVLCFTASLHPQQVWSPEANILDIRVHGRGSGDPDQVSVCQVFWQQIFVVFRS